MPGRHWDLFCRVVDNFGDIGVCWRLAADLASRGQTVRLWADDASALAWLAPAGAPGVSVRAWADADSAAEPGDVVIEAFGCDPPAGFVQRMAQWTRPPTWINLEHLSAERYVERCHRLRSPQAAGPGAGLVKHFFYPGFTAATGGLIRESDLAERQRRFDRAAWLHARGIDRLAGERVVSLFCYELPALRELLSLWSREPTLLLTTPGSATAQVDALLGPTRQSGALRAVPLPWLDQRDHDHLLWAADLNVVRGEDSFVRAQWAGVPFVWQIYVQADGAHQAKLQAFLDLFLAGADAGLAAPVRRAWLTCNGAPAPGLSARDAAATADANRWRRHCEVWRDRLASQPDLGSALIDFVAAVGSEASTRIAGFSPLPTP